MRPLLAVSVAMMLALAWACDPAPRTPHPSPYGLDDFGDTIRPPAHATRIVSLNPTTTEILFALGAGARLVGRTQYDNWPDSARFVPNIGLGIRPNIEAVLAAKPDLVLLYGSEDNRAAAARLRQAGIATAAFKVDRIEQFDRLTRLLGRLIGDSARGALVADTVRRTLDSARALTRGLPRPTVVMPAWDSPLLVIGGGSFMNQLVEIAGGRNVYDSSTSPSPAVAFEDIVRRDPDFILVGPESALRLRGQSKWRALRAVRQGKFLILDTAITMRPAVRLGEGAMSLVRLLHPEVKR
jgi:ABC-type Fe3+-hydroxamate transport system substrate-binding protein